MRTSNTGWFCVNSYLRTKKVGVRLKWVTLWKYLGSQYLLCTCLSAMAIRTINGCFIHFLKLCCEVILCMTYYHSDTKTLSWLWSPHCAVLHRHGDAVPDTIGPIFGCHHTWTYTESYHGDRDRDGTMRTNASDERMAMVSRILKFPSLGLFLSLSLSLSLSHSLNLSVEVSPWHWLIVQQGYVQAQCWCHTRSHTHMRARTHTYFKTLQASLKCHLHLISV